MIIWCRFCSIFNNKDVRKAIEGRRFIRQIRLHVTVVSLHREPPYNYVAKFAMTQWFWGTAVRMFAHQKRNINIKLKLYLSCAQSWFLSWWVALKLPRWSHWSFLLLVHLISNISSSPTSSKSFWTLCVGLGQTSRRRIIPNIFGAPVFGNQLSEQ